MTFFPTNTPDFDRLADKVSEDFLTSGIPLNEGIKVAAADSQLNPEQIKRLVEKTNTMATVKVLKSSMDKKAEFGLADSELILAGTHGSFVSPTDAMKTASAHGDIPTTLPNCRATGYPELLFKTAMQDTPAVRTRRGKDMVTIFQLEKKATELMTTKMAHELRVQDHIDFIISEFSAWGAPSFSKFANEAVTVHGDIVAPVLTKIAEYLTEPTEFCKVAYVVDDSGKLIKRAGEIISGLQDIIRTGQELTQTKALLADAWVSAKAA